MMARSLKNQIVPFRQRGVLTPISSRRTPSQSFAHQPGSTGVVRFYGGGLRGLGMGVEATDSAIFNQARYVDPSQYSVYPDRSNVNVVHQSTVDTTKQAQAVGKFSDWLNKNFPVVFSGALRARPDLLIPEFAVAGLAGLSLRRRLAGLGDTTTDTTNSSTPSTDATMSWYDTLFGPNSLAASGDTTGTTVSDGTTPTDTTPSTSWGQQISNLLATIGGPLAATYEQSQLMQINIKRAELGLPPLDSTAAAPTVNVGIPPSQMTAIANIGKVVGLGMIGLGALYLLTRKRGR